MRWFDIPLYLLRPMIDAIPRLIAEESLIAVERAQVGSGQMKREDASKVLRAWQRITDPAPRERRAVSQDEIRQMFSGLPGVQVIREPARGS